MLGTHYNYKSAGSIKFKDLKVLLYTFKCNFNVYYIIEVEIHPNNVFIIKFFQKNHRNSKNKYSLVNSKKFLSLNESNGAKIFLTILNTIIKIALEIYSTNKNACFGFMGSPTKEEANPKNTSKKYNKTINPDNTVAKTKRYGLYSIYIKRYFSPNDFIHIQSPTSSSYMLKSSKNTKVTPPYVQKFFANYIANYC